LAVEKKFIAAMSGYTYWCAGTNARKAISVVNYVARGFAGSAIVAMIEGPCSRGGSLSINDLVMLMNAYASLGYSQSRLPIRQIGYVEITYSICRHGNKS